MASELGFDISKSGDFQGHFNTDEDATLSQDNMSPIRSPLGAQWPLYSALYKVPGILEEARLWGAG